MITRIYTDLAATDIAVLANEIAADSGTFSQQDQDDGRFTVIAEFPGDEAPAAGAAEPP
jgi:hypothetical protein